MRSMVYWRVVGTVLVPTLAIGIAAVTVLPVWAGFLVEGAVLIVCLALAAQALRGSATELEE